MSGFRSTRTRVALVATALLLPLFAFVSPAQADDPAAAASATTTRLFRSAGPFPRTITINARVRSADGVPTGTVTFYEVGDPDPLGDPIPLDATGLASTYVGTPVCGPFGGCEPDVYRAVFEPTGDFAASESTEGDGLPLKLVGEPTILGIGGPSLLKIPLTTAVHAYYSDGVPAEGALAYFTYGGNAESADQSKVKQVCFVTADVNGYASCKGQGTGAAIVSLLSGGAWANVISPDYPGSIALAKLPVIAVLK